MRENCANEGELRPGVDLGGLLSTPLPMLTQYLAIIMQNPPFLSKADLIQSYAVLILRYIGLFLQEIFSVVAPQLEKFGLWVLFNLDIL